MKEKTRKTTRQWVTKVALALLACMLVGNTECFAQRLSEQQKRAIERRVKSKVEEFQFYIGQLADRRFTNSEMREEAYKLAMDLFVGHGNAYTVYDIDTRRSIRKNPVRIEISSKGRGVTSRPYIRDYMRNLKNDRRYSQVVIQQADAVYVDQIYETGNGQYECIAYFTQKYVSYREGRIVYSDITTKAVRVTIERIDVPRSDGSTRTIWNALLGDIYVESTESL